MRFVFLRVSFCSDDFDLPILVIRMDVYSNMSVISSTFQSHLNGPFLVHSLHELVGGNVVQPHVKGCFGLKLKLPQLVKSKPLFSS